MNVSLRRATEDDLELLLAWRSNPRIYEHFLEQDGPLCWSDHVTWWRSRQDRRDWIITVEEDETVRSVGSVYATDLDEPCPEIGIYVGEVCLWGQGVATAGLERSIDELRDMGYESVKARIRAANERSIELFEKIGFEKRTRLSTSGCEYQMSL